MPPPNDSLPPADPTRTAPLRRRVAWIIGLFAILIASGAAAPAGPPEELLRRKLRCPPDDPAALLDVARYAAEHQLHEHTDDLLRDVLDLDPQNQAAYDLLVELAASTPLRARSPALDDARAKLPDRFRTIETDHFVVLTDAAGGWANTKAGELERAYEEFHNFCIRLDLRPHPLEHKLVCVLFAQRATYEQFARTHDSVDEGWIAGYYAPLGDRVVFYDVRSSPGLLQAAGELETMRRELLQVQRQARDARLRGDREASAHFASLASTYESHLDGERARVEHFAQRVSTATTIHESIHQLLFHTRVQHPRVHYPLWISEGLACSFETAEPRHAFGPQEDDPIRREAFEQALRDDTLRPLRQLVKLTEVGHHDESSIEGAYHQCAALLRWLHRHRRDELRTYLNLMLAEPPGRPTPARHLRVFEQAFGDVDQLEATWLKHERSTLRHNLAIP